MWSWAALLVELVTQQLPYQSMCLTPLEIGRKVGAGGGRRNGFTPVQCWALAGLTHCIFLKSCVHVVFMSSCVCRRQPLSTTAGVAAQLLGARASNPPIPLLPSQVSDDRLRLLYL